MTQAWVVAPGAKVHLVSDRIGLMSMDGTAPVTSGALTMDESHVYLELVIALDQVKANLLMQTAVRSLVKRYNATALIFRGAGEVGHDPLVVIGEAHAGEVVVSMTLTIERTGVLAHVFGTAYLGTVDLPLPGVGKIDNFSFSVETQLTLDAH